jgi:hypothetical protein
MAMMAMTTSNSIKVKAFVNTAGDPAFEAEERSIGFLNP